MKPDRSDNYFRCTAVTVDCCEAIDWEIVRVTFDTEEPDFDEEDRTSPYLSVSANFEFGDEIQAEFHDGQTYHGDQLRSIELWRDRVVAITVRGYEFDFDFDLTEDAFCQLREYLKVLLRSDRFQQRTPAEQAAPSDHH